MKITAYTDGACTSSTDCGAWAAVLVMEPKAGQEEVIELKGGPYPSTTNNQMELFAVVETLAYLRDKLGKKFHNTEIVVTSDSEYVVKGINEWIEGWKNRGWKTASGSKVKNQNLWELLENQISGAENLVFQWVRGHDNNKYNERADDLAFSLSQRSKEKQ